MLPGLRKWLFLAEEDKTKSDIFRGGGSKHEDPCTPLEAARSEEMDFLRTCSSERTDLLPLARVSSSVTSDIVKSINTKPVRKDSSTIRWKCPICEENWE